MSEAKGSQSVRADAPVEGRARGPKEPSARRTSLILRTCAIVFATVCLVAVFVAAVWYFLGLAFLLAWTLASVLGALLWSAWRDGSKADAEEVRIDAQVEKARRTTEWARELREYRADRKRRTS